MNNNLLLMSIHYRSPVLKRLQIPIPAGASGWLVYSCIHRVNCRGEKSSANGHCTCRGWQKDMVGRSHLDHFRTWQMSFSYHWMPYVQLCTTSSLSFFTCTCHFNFGGLLCITSWDLGHRQSACVCFRLKCKWPQLLTNMWTYWRESKTVNMNK